ncbi:MAG TPA: hypothetical protein PKA85_12280, partial [Ferruginibacter sp.]|nr:hypothetical protein [Ferruginibacter sp.]
GGDVQLAAASIPAGAGQATVGTGTGTSSTTGITPFTSNYQSNRTQYLVRASELTAAGIVSGNITSLAFNITTGTTFPLVNYSVRMAHTSATALSAAFLTPTFTTVYTEASFVPGTTTGWRELTFSTPFNWDGTSNIVIDICHDNVACSGGFGVCWAGNSTVQVSTTAYNSVFARYSDTQVMCGTDGSGSALSTYTSRPNMRFGAQVGVNLTSTLTWEWNPGALSGATVTVNPTTTTTYTVSATDANGCVATDDVEVTVLDLPATPVATPSTQCGEGVPTASVSGGSGTFLWYDAPTGGNLVQTGGSTYTGTVSTSTTFYVAESDGTCESERVAVEITVNAPDPITAVAADNNICIGEDVELSVTQDGSNQTYTYTWTATPEAGSGITGSLNGGTQTITPTAAGTYVYQVAGFDPAGPCNITSTVS